MSPFGRDAKRIMQGTFSQCEYFSWGLAYAGFLVASAYCNEAGDISESHWSTELDQAPFNRNMAPVWNKVKP